MKETILIKFYNILIAIFSPIIFSVIVIKSFKHKKHIMSHFGKGIEQSKKQTIWIHAVSVGEVHLLKKLIEELSKENLITVSTVTKTGNSAANLMFEKLISDGGAKVIYFPIDYKPIVDKYIKLINPKLIILVETEIWPNFLYEASEKRIPVVLINGRISKRSSKWYRKFRFFFKPLIGKIAMVCVQDEEEKKHFLEYQREDRISVTGNLKYTNTVKLKSKLKKPNDKIVIIAGSTHDSEEKIIFDILGRLGKRLPLLLIIAPRHLNRLNLVENIAKNAKLHTVRLTKFNGYDSIDTIIVDTVGDLSSLYEIADIAFIGGSMTKIGGHNPIEACLYSVPVVIGKHYFNFDQIVSELVENKGILIAADKDDLQEKFEELLQSREKRMIIGNAGNTVVNRHVDDLQNTVNILHNFL